MKLFITYFHILWICSYKTWYWEKKNTRRLR